MVERSLDWRGFAIMAAVLAAACAPAPESDNARMVREQREERTRLAAQWDGRCPDWSAYRLTIVTQPRPGPPQIVSAAANAHLNPAAALCMADHYADDAAYAAQRYFWLAFAEELGADVGARADAVAETLPPAIAAYERFRAREAIARESELRRD